MADASAPRDDDVLCPWCGVMVRYGQWQDHAYEHDVRIQAGQTDAGARSMHPNA